MGGAHKMGEYTKIGGEDDSIDVGLGRAGNTFERGLQGGCFFSAKQPQQMLKTVVRFQGKSGCQGAVNSGSAGRKNLCEQSGGVGKANHRRMVFGEFNPIQNAGQTVTTTHDPKDIRITF